MRYEEYVSLILTQLQLVNPDGNNIHGQLVGDISVSYAGPLPLCILIEYVKQSDLLDARAVFPTDIYFLNQDDIAATGQESDTVISPRSDIAEAFLKNLYDMRELSLTDVSLNYVRKVAAGTFSGIRLRFNLLTTDSTTLDDCGNPIALSSQSVISAYNKLSEGEKEDVRNAICV